MKRDVDSGSLEQEPGGVPSSTRYLLIVLMVFGINLLTQPSSRERYLRRLEDEARKFRDHLPIKVSDEILVTGMKVTSGKVVYEYMLMEVDSSEDDLKALETSIRESVLFDSCSKARKIETPLSNGVDTHYSYFDRKNDPLFVIRVTPDDCGLSNAETSVNREIGPAFIDS